MLPSAGITSSIVLNSGKEKKRKEEEKWQTRLSRIADTALRVNVEQVICLKKTNWLTHQVGRDLGTTAPLSNCEMVGWGAESNQANRETPQRANQHTTTTQPVPSDVIDKHMVWQLCRRGEANTGTELRQLRTLSCGNPSPLSVHRITLTTSVSHALIATIRPINRRKQIYIEQTTLYKVTKMLENTIQRTHSQPRSPSQA